MRGWTKVWIAVAVVCIGLTIYEIPKAVRIFRFSQLLRKERYTTAGKLNVPAVVTDKLIAEDPEAGDMLTYCLTYSYENPNIEDLAALAEKWPKNEFFLSQLAEQLTRESIVDSRTALALVDRLLNLNPENAHSRYLRGWIFLTDPNRTNHEQDALEEFEIGHRLPQFYLPYSKYKDRLDLLCEKATIFWEQPWLWPFYTDLANQLFRSSLLRRRLSENMFHDLNGSVSKIGDRLIENAYDSQILLAGVVLLGHGEEVRLRDMDLPEAEAQRSRLRVARARALLVMHRQLLDSNDDTLAKILLVIFQPPMLLWLAFLFLFGIVFDFIPFLQRRRQQKVGKYIRIWMFINFGLVFVLILIGVPALWDNGPLRIWRASLMFLAGMFTLTSALGLSDTHYIKLAELRRPKLWIAGQCSSLWFKGTVFWTVGNLVIFEADNSANWLWYSAILLVWSFLCVLVWIRAAYRTDTTFPKFRHAVALIVYWVVILMVFHIGGMVTAQLNSLYVYPLWRYGSLPQATQETYNRVILGQGDVAVSSAIRSLDDLLGVIEHAAPDDLRAFISRHLAAGETISDRQLRKMLRDCNRDLRPILLAELTDPNAYEVLVIRAGWGDRSVKEPLERIYWERLAAFRESEPEPPPGDPSSLGELLELAGTLACISDGPEAQERFSYLMEQVVEKTRSLVTSPDLGDPRYTDRIMQPFWESLCKLPPASATTLIKTYLRQTRFVDLSTDRGRAIIHLADLLADSDRELAEEVVAALAGLPSAPESSDAPTRESEQQRTFRLKRHRDRNAPPCLEAIFAHLTAESIPLLLEHFDSDNEQLRAFIVWRATTLGYEWPSEQLRELLNDPYWKVRLNTLFALDPDGLEKALDDENAVVRIIAQILRHPQPS